VLSLDRLRVLHAVATTGSVAGAARALHVTTSAVSQQLARLEREVADRLVERHGRGIRLTEAGRRLAHDAAGLLVHVERVEAGLARRKGAVAGRMTVAAFATAARGLLPGTLRELRERHPALTVWLAEHDPHEAVPALLRGRVDVAVVQDWTDDVLVIGDGIARRNLLTDGFDIALPTGHSLAGREAVAVKELAGEDWIGWRADQICHSWLVRTLRAEGIEARVTHTASEHSTQLALVAAGLGVAVLPRLGRDPVPDTVRMVAIDPPPARRVFAIWRESMSASPAVAAVVEALAERATASDAIR
jgi:DNA-binding transcriptional LysR family regulator